MLTTNVKLYTYVCMRQLISIFLKKRTIRTIFSLKVFVHFITKIRKKRRRKTCHNSSISLFSDFIFKLNFSPMENGYLRMQILPRRNWKKSGAYHYLFSPDSLVCIYGGGPLCLKSSQTHTSTLATLNMVENTRYQSRITESRFIPVLSGRFETNDFDDERKR